MSATEFPPKAEAVFRLITGAELGRPVPVFPLSGSVPLLNSNGFYDATDDPTIVGVFERSPGYNVGVRLGRPSGLVMLDLDTHREGVALEDVELALLNHLGGRGVDLPATRSESTGGGGLHLLFWVPAGWVVHTKTDLLPNIDLKAELSYGVVTPSVTSGPYSWVEPLRPVAELPEPALYWLADLDLAHREGESCRRCEGGGSGGVRTSDGSGGDPIPDGRRNDTLASLAGSMRRVGMSEDAILAALRETNAERCRPPLDDEEVQRIAESIASYVPEFDPASIPWAFVEGMRAWRPSPLTDLQGNELPAEVTARVGALLTDRWAMRVVSDLEAEAARGPRPKRTAREYADVPQPASVLDGVLAAEVNLLAGPSEAGKSLLARDWCLSLAAGEPWRGHPVPGPRGCLFIASEGLHDFRERWLSSPLWERAADRVHVLDEPVNLVSSGDVEWLLSEYAGERPGLVVFDVIYAMGLPDDNGTKDVVPLITSMKRISAEWGAATLALGHPGHNGDRRFRGSSAWRQLAAVEWHLGDDRLTCEKSKIADKRRLSAPYLAEYPELRWLTSSEALGDAADRYRAIHDDFERYPGDNDTARVRRLMPVLGLRDRRTRDLIKTVRAADDLL